MCLVMQTDIWETERKDYSCYKLREYVTEYYSWRLDYHGLAVRLKRPVNKLEWTIFEHGPRFHDKKHGWCIEYTDQHPNIKQREGWYTNGKAEGEHRKYATVKLHTPGKYKAFLQEIIVYEADVIQQVRKYDVHGNVTYKYNYVNGQLHGICYLYVDDYASLFIQNKEVVANIADLHIDYTNITEADMFTLSLLGA